MNSETIIEKLREKLEPRKDVYALWLEGSIPQGFGDEYSDLDIWISTDDNKVFDIYDEIEQILEELGKIDFKYVTKPSGELGATTYHIEGMSEFLQIDINTQGLSRNIYLIRGIDDATVIFDKNNIVKFKKPQSYTKLEYHRNKLQDFFQLMRPNLIKSVKRNRPLETLYYWHMILQYTIELLRRKNGWAEKIGFGLKHIHRDLPKNDAEKILGFYRITNSSEILNQLDKLKTYIDSI